MKYGINKDMYYGEFITLLDFIMLALGTRFYMYECTWDKILRSYEPRPYRNMQNQIQIW